MIGEADAHAAGSTGGASRAAIESHYDVGRDFYRLWLDKRMVYSCALWPSGPDEDLERAQLAKLDWHAEAAEARGKSHVLDVGCGWGAMLRHLREDCHVEHATGLTLSSDQASSMAGADGIEVRLEDWRCHEPVQPYDAVISIGAFEHFARTDVSQDQRRAIYGQFFESCARWLRPECRLSLQCIAWEDLGPIEGRPVSSFFTQEIFPESCLPSLSDIVVASEKYFRLVAFRSDAEHYSRTLQVWQRRLELHQQQAQHIVGREVYRKYLRYLRVSRAMFDRRTCTLYRIAFQRRPLRQL